MGIYHGRRRNRERREAEAKAKFDALSPKEKRHIREKEYWTLSDQECDEYETSIDPIVHAEYEHMKAQNYISPYMTYKQTLGQIDDMLKENYYHRYPDTARVRILQDAYNKGGKAAVITYFAKMIDETNDMLLARLEHEPFQIVQEAADRITLNLVPLHNSKRFKPLTVSGTLSSEFPGSMWTNSEISIKSIVDNNRVNDAFSKVVGSQRYHAFSEDEFPEPTPQEFMTVVRDNKGVTFKGLPEYYVKTRLAAKGLRTFTSEPQLDA